VEHLALPRGEIGGELFRPPQESSDFCAEAFLMQTDAAPATVHVMQRRDEFGGGTNAHSSGCLASVRGHTVGTGIDSDDGQTPQSFVQRRNRSSFPPKGMNQVFGRSNVPPSRYLCIARLTQLLSKLFKHAAIWAVA
jgi:hypothetical protein